MLLLSLISYEVITFSIFILTPWLDWSNYAQILWLSSIGLVIGILALLIFFFVHVYLGRYFSHKIQLQKNQILVKEGPYKFIRHPMYTAFIVLHLGVFLLVPTSLLELHGLLV